MKDFDAIVIGSGAGGLTAGLAAASAALGCREEGLLTASSGPLRV